MVLKIFKAVWFLSLLVWLLAFLYVYASLPEEALLSDPNGYREGSRILISREALFYVFLGIVGLITGLVFAMSRLFADSEDLLTWFYGLIISLHFFFIIVLHFINLINSGESFDYNRIGYVIYGSLGLLVGWTTVWPVYSIFRKFFSKEGV